FNARTNILDRNCDPRSLLTRIRVNSDSAEVYVNPRNPFLTHAGAVAAVFYGLTHQEFRDRFVSVDVKRGVDWQRMFSTLRAAMWHTQALDRKSTRLNSSHVSISYAVFCL